MGLRKEEYRRLKLLRNGGSFAGWSIKPSEDLIAVRLKIDSEIAPYPDQLEAPSLRKTRAFVCSRAVLWLDSEYAVKKATRGRMFEAVECMRARVGTVVRPPIAGA